MTPLLHSQFVHTHNQDTRVLCHAGTACCAVDVDDAHNTQDNLQRKRARPAPTQPPQRKRARPPPSLNLQTVASEVLTMKCAGTCAYGGQCAFRLHSQVCGCVEHVVDARTQLYEAGHRQSSSVLFKKLLKDRETPRSVGDKYVLHFRFAGLRICPEVWCAIHGVKTTDSRMKQIFSFLRRGDCEWVPVKKWGRGMRGTGRGWRGIWCRSWMRSHVRKFADFNPVTRCATLDPDGLEVRHLLYLSDWLKRAPDSKSGNALKFSRFSELWKLTVEEGYVNDGETFEIKIRPPRSGFTCDICQKLYNLRREASSQGEKDNINHVLKQHLQQAREARDAYADNILKWVGVSYDAHTKLLLCYVVHVVY